MKFKNNLFLNSVNALSFPISCKCVNKNSASTDLKTDMVDDLFLQLQLTGEGRLKLVSGPCQAEMMEIPGRWGLNRDIMQTDPLYLIAFPPLPILFLISNFTFRSDIGRFPVCPYHVSSSTVMKKTCKNKSRYIERD